MAINKITAPLETSPSVFAAPVINWTAALLNAYHPSQLIGDGYVRQGALFSIGGTMYLADSDTSISGTESNYVAITASGSTATAAYVSSLSDVTWNGSYHNYYDTDGVLYLFDESDAINDGYITDYYNVATPTGEPRHLTAGSNLLSKETSTSNSQTAAVDSLYIVPRDGTITVQSVLNNSITATAITVNGTIVGVEHTSAGTYSETFSVSSSDIVGVSIYSLSDDDSQYASVTVSTMTGIIL